VKIHTNWVYKNIKTGGLYRVHAIGRDSESLEPVVVYTHCDWDGTHLINIPPEAVFVRPLALFLQKFREEP
jgi:hypothetical protein